MRRPPKNTSRRDLLETKISEFTAWIKEISPEARVEVSFESYEDEDANIRIYLPASIDAEEVARMELALGERCNDVLLETGLFIIGAVCD